MKKLLFGSLLLMGYMGAQAQQEYTIEGKVEGVKDGTLISLFLLDGNVGSTVALDSIQNGTFFFKRNAGESGMDKLSLMCTRNDDFPSMSLEIYATPNARIKVTGTNTLIHTWKVDSPVKEQIEHNRFIENSRDLWDEYQRLSIKARSLRSAPEAERKAMHAKEDSISALISKREMQLMQELPVSNIWMDRLHRLSMSVKYNPNFSYKDETLALYNRMNEAQKASIKGQEITVNLFPPVVVKEGDEMADTELYDLDGKIHHLTDFKGKYILLDFWSSGCGPCIMALPEMKEIQEQYKERLTVISLSSDTKSRWKAASAKHEMTWQNLSDLKQSAGLYAKYGVNGIPNYVLISPEGKIMKMWSGYGKGSLKLKMRRYLDATKREMSITQQGNTKVVNYPTSESTNTDILEVKQVELTDTATIVHFNAYYIPKYWIQVSKNIQLVDEKGASYTLQKADGITPGEHFFLPESGEAEFSLTFKPLPLETKLFNFTEGTAQNDWQINGIKLSK
ncbi:AhpC/TSA family protein [Candidatus Bacteroides intestinigallinarum]|jgi:peroxiredoxin|uniref:TlpA disulfide reductase family protein n=1 Tax=Bacteroides TaxID=816 RepID=UPI000E903B38|nr:MULTISPECIES: TlpA disulfide reductase family protein [Bacteroides]MCS3178202.1 AhpC/TSA family protein [Candidatus Bacteroides intestinigallinarum]RGN56590.1 AhpC/TSA family protein [Bacteroides sp. OM05-10AA]RGQ61818.1 AhpC/TSA family protein [Bacteroides sp. AF27-33]